MKYTCITIEGGLLAPDFLETIADAEGQKPGDFGIEGRRTLVDEVSSLWSDVRSYWDAFQRRLGRSGAESRTTMTREQWAIPLLESLGYELTFQPRAAEVAGRSYALSHRSGPFRNPRSGIRNPEEDLPVHIATYDQDLGSRPPSGRGTMSPHAMLQDYLNRTEHLWAIVTNGSTLRLLRDSSYFTRPSFVEFDLRQMLEGERLDEFFLFYRLVHRTRLPKTLDDGPNCLLEKYHQLGIEQGGRIRDGLRAAVEHAIVIFANGFLNHPRNADLHEAFRSGQLAPAAFYKQILYLIYRLLFLMVAEERGLLSAHDSEHHSAREYFTVQRLRDLADEPLSAPERFSDLYLNLRALFYSLCDAAFAEALGLPPLNGELFDSTRTSALGDAYLNNRDLLTAMHTLSWFVPRDQRVPTRVNYRHLDVEELGSVYESLLDLQPITEEEGGRLTFRFGSGTERKTTGSYYTRPELVQELIKSALVAVIDERLREVDTIANRKSKIANQREQALLSLKVCDPACGSGHFLLAAARRIGTELAKVRTGEEAPSPDAVREGVRDAITHCIYGVDKNPLAVDLCKVALWIEGHSVGKPLTFLDHRIRCGDSLVGVFDLKVLDDGIPDEAYTAVSGDDRKLASALKKQNKQERSGQTTLPLGREEESDSLLASRRSLLTLPDDTPEQVHRKRTAFEQLQAEGGKLWRDRMACHLWTAAFFWPLRNPQSAIENPIVPTTDDLRRFIENPDAVDARLRGHVWALAERNRFFHWALEFPEVFVCDAESRREDAENRREHSSSPRLSASSLRSLRPEGSPGFDVVLSNPPWERIKLQEQEFFATRDPEIASAPNKAARERLIKALAQHNPGLLQDFQQELHAADATSKFLRQSERFPLTARGDINTYAVFAELSRGLLAPAGRTGIIVPTGIATDDTTKTFFGDLIEKQSLSRLIGFENEAFIFPAVHHAFKFCTLTLNGQAAKLQRPNFVFFCRHFQHVAQSERNFELTREDFALISPNTRTCPIFRTRADAELTKSIYRRVPVLVNEEAGENPWGVRFMTMFHMANDSGLFRTEPGEGLLPLYEGKMTWQFDHRYATYKGASQADLNAAILPQPREVQKQDPKFGVVPRYWVPQAEVETRLDDWRHGWLLGFRDITGAVMERSGTFSLLPRSGVGHTMPLVKVGESFCSLLVLCLLGDLNSLVLDFIIRTKLTYVHLPYFTLKQLPVLPPSTYTPADIAFIAPRVLELVYTAWDLKPFAEDMGYHGEPFRWDEERRALLRAELDAYYARLYGLTFDELRYILDPKDVHGPDFPGETFRVLKDKEEKAFGEYRTRRLVLEAWERQERGGL